MKKTLFFVLLISAVSILATGCFIERWFGTDDDSVANSDSQTSTTVNSISGVVNIPASGLSDGAHKALFRSVSGVTVYLLLTTADVSKYRTEHVAKTLTNANGLYKFTGIDAGSYLVIIDLDDDGNIEAALQASTTQENGSAVLEDVYIRNINTGLKNGSYVMVTTDRKTYSAGNTITVTASGNVTALEGSKFVFIEIWNENDSEALLFRSSAAQSTGTGNFSLTFTAQIPSDWPGSFSPSRPQYKVYLCTPDNRIFKMAFNGVPVPNSTNTKIANASFLLDSPVTAEPEFVLYALQGGDGTHIYKVSLDGTGNMLLRNTAGIPTLSTNQSKFIFYNPGFLHSMSLSGLRDVALNIAYPYYKISLNGDGTKAVYAAGTELSSIDTATKAVQVLHSSGAELTAPWVSSDGNTFVCFDSGDFNIYYGSDVLQVSSLIYTGSDITWSGLCLAPDASAVVYSRAGNLYKVPLSTKVMEELTTIGTQNYYPLYSPDSSKIAYFDEGNLYVMDADGSNLKQVAQQVFTYKYSWTRDSSRIVYLGEDQNVYLIRADGSQVTSPKQLTTGGQCSNPSASSMTRSEDT